LISLRWEAPQYHIEAPFFSIFKDAHSNETSKESAEESHTFFAGAKVQKRDQFINSLEWLTKQSPYNDHRP